MAQDVSRDPEDKKRDLRNDSVINAGLAGAQIENVQLHGNAVKQHCVAYSGKDRETGQQMAKGLKKISQSKINPRHKNANIKQQAGFAAEGKTVARENAEKILKGKKIAKVTRTDDMQKAGQSDGKGNSIGGKNDPLYDIAEVDSNGIYVQGTARQLKFVGGTPKECTAKLLSSSYDKYRDAEIPIEVPSDFYDGIKEGLENKANSIKEQIKTAEKAGNLELAAKKKAELEKVEKTNKNLKKGKLTKQEAIEARVHPKVSTAKDVAKISHQAAVAAAKSGAIIGGGISFIRNSVAVIKGDKNPREAAIDITKDGVNAAALSYATGFVGAALQGGMQNAPSTYVRCLSKTNLPGLVVTSVLETGKTLKRYADSEINGVECLAELGEKGTGMLASSMGAAIGQVIIPIPIVGGLIGGMIGYSMSSAYYNQLVTALHDAKIAREERLRIEAECKEAIIAIDEYRTEIELVIANYLQQHIQEFNKAFSNMEIAYNTGCVNEFILSTNRITRQLGGEPSFESKREFDVMMSKPAAFKI